MKYIFMFLVRLVINVTEQILLRLTAAIIEELKPETTNHTPNLT